MVSLITAVLLLRAFICEIKYIMLLYLSFAITLRSYSNNRADTLVYVVLYYCQVFKNVMPTTAVLNDRRIFVNCEKLILSDKIKMLQQSRRLLQGYCSTHLFLFIAHEISSTVK